MNPLDRLLPKVGDRFANYELTEEIGRGGFGAVYRARQAGLDADVAIKFMLPQPGQDRMRFAERFEREAQVMKTLEHSAALKVRDFGHTPDGAAFLVMEFVRGHTLSSELRERGPMPLERVLRIADQALGCLAEAHHRGVVHRDLKPDNIMVRDIVGERDAIKVLDFGIAKLQDDASALTATGTAFGTPWYMAPEQARGQKDVDGRLDLYALGLILAECLSGQRVVQEDSLLSAVHAQTRPEPLPFPETVTTSPLWPVIAGATHKAREHRYPDALTMRQALEDVRGRLVAAAYSASSPVGAGLQSGPGPPEQPLPATAPAPHTGPAPAHTPPVAMGPNAVWSPQMHTAAAPTGGSPQAPTGQSHGPPKWLIGVAVVLVIVAGVVATLVLGVSGSGSTDGVSPSAPVESEFSDEIIIAGVGYPLGGDIRVANPVTHPGYDFTNPVEETCGVEREGLAIARNTALREWASLGHEYVMAMLRDDVTQIILHHDATYSSETTYQVLCTRGLSTHFMINHDGSILQGLDPVYKALHATEFNPTSIGIDLNNMAIPRDDAVPRHESLFDSTVDYTRRPTQPGLIQGTEHENYTYTDAQYRSLAALLDVLHEQLAIPRTVPGRDGTGHTGLLAAPTEATGVLAHYHITEGKWDPGPSFDWGRLAADVGATFVPPHLGTD